MGGISHHSINGSSMKVLMTPKYYEWVVFKSKPNLIFIKRVFVYKNPDFILFFK